MLLTEILIAFSAILFLSYLSFIISKKYRSFSIFISLIFIIFWSLAGAIPLLIGKLVSGEDKPIFIIERELFLISPDLNYFYVLCSYILFISSILYSLWRFHPFLERRFQSLSKYSWATFAESFSHTSLLFFNGIVVIIVLINLNAIEFAAGDMPIYLTDNRVPSRIIDYARTGVLFSTALGAILFAIGATPGKLKKWIFSVLYVSIFLMACYPFWISGSRNTLFLAMVGLIVGTVSLKEFSNNSFFQKINEVKLIFLLVLISFLCISVTTTTRGMSLSGESVSSIASTVVPDGEASTVVPDGEASTVVPDGGFQKRSALIVKSSAVLQALTTKSSYTDWIGRGEILDSHASLYGVMSKMNSVPSIKLENSYVRYAKIIGITGSRGYTINPVAALWMNIGVFAPFVAGGYFSLIILFFWCISRVSPRKFWPVVALSSIAFSSAAIPVILSRSGPEGLWGLFINIIFLPAFFLFAPTFCALRKVKN